MILKQYIAPTPTFSDLCERIRTGQHFTFARYGDGEFYALLGRKKTEAILGRPSSANCDGHEYFPDMGAELAAILRDRPPYLLGLHLDEKLATVTHEFLSDAGYEPGSFIWSGVFHRALVNGQMPELFEALHSAATLGRIVFVGPPHLHHAVAENFPVTYTLSVSPLNCWIDTEVVMRMLGHIDLTGCVVLFCASMAANVWIHRLWRQYGDTATFIDLGSVLDPYAGRMTRSFHRKAKI